VAACADGGSPATGLNAGFNPNSVQSRSGVTTEDESKRALNIEQKKAVVAEVADAANKALAAVAAEYRGLTVEEMTELRVKAREGGVVLKVAKNTLVRRAVEGTEYECMQDSLTGPLLFAFSMDDPGAAARLVKDYSKDHDKLIAKLVAVGGDLYDASELERLSNLPTYDQAIAILMGVMKAPIEKFVRTLAEPHTKMVRTVAAVRDSKQAA
jgi:large subunit ribosomal protein L10